MAFHPQQARVNVNGRIRAREVRVIIAASKEQLGVMRTSDALRRANQMGLDLVEVAPTANPPVCQIVDFGKYRYEQAKHEKDKRHSSSKLKEVKFRVNIDEHDYTTKLRRAEEFLDKGNKVKVQLQFRGREMAHQELGEQLVRRVRDDLTGMSQVEAEPRKAGRSINMMLAPLPSNRRKRKFMPLSDEEMAAADAAENEAGDEEEAGGEE